MLLSSAHLYLKFSPGILVSTFLICFCFPPRLICFYSSRLRLLHPALCYDIFIPFPLSRNLLSSLISLTILFIVDLSHFYSITIILMRSEGGRKRWNCICSVHSLESDCTLKCSGRRQGLWGEEMFSFYETHFCTAQFVAFVCVSIVFITERIRRRIDYSDLLSLSSVWCWKLLPETGLSPWHV